MSRSVTLPRAVRTIPPRPWLVITTRSIASALMYSSISVAAGPVSTAPTFFVEVQAAAFAAMYSFAAAVTVDQSQGGFGGTIAAPIAKAVIQTLLSGGQ